MSRHFTIEKSEIGFNGGQYNGSEPYRVASKAARALFDHLATKKNKKTEKKGEIRFTLRETTAGSKKREYTYVAMKKSYDKPLIVKRGDTEIKIHHTYHVKSCAVRD